VANHSGARQATNHLIEGGRKRIAILTGPLAWWEARERFAGWKAAIVQAGLNASESLVAESYWSSAGGDRAMQELLEREPGIDGVFASSDQIALGALKAIHDAGRNVPRDIAIIGFDNMPESEYFQPSLSTVHQGLADVGGTAVRQAHQMIEARRDERHMPSGAVTLIQPEMVIRASSI
jgi:DNA-binding LacI/PurR family transcriptional regulator